MLRNKKKTVNFVGFFQRLPITIRISEEPNHRTSLITRKGMYRFTRLSAGLVTGSTFLRVGARNVWQFAADRDILISRRLHRIYFQHVVDCCCVEYVVLF